MTYFVVGEPGSLTNRCPCERPLGRIPYGRRGPIDRESAEVIVSCGLCESEASLFVARTRHLGQGLSFLRRVAALGPQLPSEP